MRVHDRGAGLDARVVSLCLSNAWRTSTLAAVAPLVPPTWLARLDAREQDIATADFEAIVDGAVRVLVFWDAHGYHVADHVLGRLLPSIADRPHLVLMHDISDVRYEGRPAGRVVRRPRPVARLRLERPAPPARSHRHSCVEQAVSVVDFTSRNAVTLHTAAEEIHGVIGAHRFRVEAMERTLGDLWAPAAHWCHFSLNDGSGPYQFPAAARDSRAGLSDGGAYRGARCRQGLRPMSSSRRRDTRSRSRSWSQVAPTITAGPSSWSASSRRRRTTMRCSTRAGIPHTFTLVEWNPVPGRRLLAEAVAVERLPFWSRAYVVDPEWHGAISTNPRLQFMEFFAKNVAVRRSTADAILTTNSDVFLSRRWSRGWPRHRSRTSTSTAPSATTSIAIATGGSAGAGSGAGRRRGTTCASTS